MIDILEEREDRRGRVLGAVGHACGGAVFAILELLNMRPCDKISRVYHCNRMSTGLQRLCHAPPAGAASLSEGAL